MAETQEKESLRAVAAWHEALNAGETERLVSLSHPEVEIVGPRGSVRGREVLKDWVARANVRLEPGRRFGRGGVVVVEQVATWRDPETGEKTGEAVVATAFTVEGGLVTSVARDDEGLEEALRGAGLDLGDESPPTL